LLLRELTGVQDVGAGLRAVCLEAVHALLAVDPDEVVVIGGAEASGTAPRDAVLDVRSYGSDTPRAAGSTPQAPGSTPRAAGPAAASPPVLPLSLGVGSRLLDECRWTGSRELRSVAWDAAPADCLAVGRQLAARPARTALLVMGDGSAQRAVKAPGHVDARGAAFDAQVSDALAAGDAHALARLDPLLAADLLVAGRAAWQVLAGAIAGTGTIDARLLYAGEPFGVLYLVATWLPV